MDWGGYPPPKNKNSDERESGRKLEVKPSGFVLARTLFLSSIFHSHPPDRKVNERAIYGAWNFENICPNRCGISLILNFLLGDKVWARILSHFSMDLNQIERGTFDSRARMNEKHDWATWRVFEYHSYRLCWGSTGLRGETRVWRVRRVMGKGKKEKGARALWDFFKFH